MGWGQFGWRGSHDSGLLLPRSQIKTVASYVLEQAGRQSVNTRGCRVVSGLSGRSPLLPAAVYAWGNSWSGIALRPACVRL